MRGVSTVCLGLVLLVIFSGENDGKAYGALEKSVMAAMTAKTAYAVPSP